MSAKRVTGAAAAVVVAAMALGEPAWAGTVGYQLDPNRGQAFSVVMFTAAPGETNDTTASLTPTTAVITDPGNPMVADPAFAVDTSAHCVFSADRTVCTADPTAPFTRAVLQLGDGNDRGRVIVAVPDNETFLGGPPAESGAIYGGPGDDVLIGSAGDDSLVGGPGADDIRGGGGIGDWASYAQDGDQTTGVRVTLDDQANDGHPGEHDNVHSDVENVEGALQGDNVLIGDAADNVLMGHQGSDTLRGGAGDDTLYAGFDAGDRGNNDLDGGPGLDTFVGSDGSDIMRADDGLPDLRITCNGGSDVVFADALDRPDPDCETVKTG